MTPTLHMLSEWVLALLPRLLIYPGGLWAIAALAVWRALSPRLSLRAWRQTPARALSNSNSHMPAALAWVGLALSPLPGASPLPFPADRLSLAGVLVLSLVAALGTKAEHVEAPGNEERDGGEGEEKGEGGEGAGAYGRLPLLVVVMGAALPLAALSPLAGGRSLLGESSSAGVPAWLALGAVVAGVAALQKSRRAPGGDLRALAWLGLAGGPLWALVPTLPSLLSLPALTLLPGAAPVLPVSVFYTLLLALVSAAARAARPHTLAAICFGLAVPALLWALVS